MTQGQDQHEDQIQCRATIMARVALHGGQLNHGCITRSKLLARRNVLGLMERAFFSALLHPPLQE